MTNRKRGALYVGVTSNLENRATQHREGAIDGFTLMGLDLSGPLSHLQGR